MTRKGRSRLPPFSTAWRMAAIRRGGAGDFALEEIGAVQLSQQCLNLRRRFSQTIFEHEKPLSMPGQACGRVFCALLHGLYPACNGISR